MVAHKNINFSRKKKKEKIEFNQAHYLVVNLNKMCFGIKFFPFKVNNKNNVFFLAWQQHERNDIHVFLLFYLQPRGIIAPKCDHSLQRESREPPRLLPNERQHGGSPLYFSSLLFLKLFFFLFLLFCIFVPGTTKAVSGREESFNCRSLAPDKNLIRKD